MNLKDRLAATGIDFLITFRVCGTKKDGLSGQLYALCLALHMRTSMFFRQVN